MKLNLYKIGEDNITVGSVRVSLDNELRELLNNIVTNFKEKYTVKEISSLLGIDYTTLWDYCNRSTSIPLIILEKLEKLSGNKFSKENFKFVCGHQKIKVKLPIKINENLARIIGAIIADGHLKIRKSKRGYHYELVLREGYKSNVDAFSKWFFDQFNIILDIKKLDNHYYIYCSNKIIVLYLTKVLGLPSGKKVDIISIPQIIKNSSRSIKTAVLQGVFMFDGGVDYATSYVGLTTRSMNLFEDVRLILSQIGFEPDYVSSSCDKYQRWKILFRKKSNLFKCKVLFEQDTIKWQRLQDHFHNLNIKLDDFQEIIAYFNKYYPKVRKSSISFSDVILAVNELDESNMLEIGKKLKKGSTTIQAYLSKLTSWNILTSRRVGLKKYWRLNHSYGGIYNGRKNGRQSD
jgi:hypothetical protein